MLELLDGDLFPHDNRLFDDGSLFNLLLDLDFNVFLRFLNSSDSGSLDLLLLLLDLVFSDLLSDQALLGDGLRSSRSGNRSWKIFLLLLAAEEEWKAAEG